MDSETKLFEEEPNVIGFICLGSGVIVPKSRSYYYIKYEEVTYLSLKSFLTSYLICFLVSLLVILSSVTTFFSSISPATMYLVGSKWL